MCLVVLKKKSRDSIKKLSVSSASLSTPIHPYLFIRSLSNTYAFHLLSTPYHPKVYPLQIHTPLSITYLLLDFYPLRIYPSLSSVVHQSTACPRPVFQSPSSSNRQPRTTTSLSGSHPPYLPSSLDDLFDFITITTANCSQPLVVPGAPVSEEENRTVRKTDIVTFCILLLDLTPSATQPLVNCRTIVFSQSPLSLPDVSAHHLVWAKALI